jgi:hypothetical protein
MESGLGLDMLDFAAWFAAGAAGPGGAGVVKEALPLSSPPQAN